MKKLITLILSLAFVLVMVGCSQKDDLQQGNNKMQYFFSGKVIEPTDNNTTPGTEQTQQAQIEKDNTAYPPSVMVDDIVYKDTGYVSSMLGCGNMDGEITSEVDGTKLPIENNQSNFGSGYQYQRGSEGHILVVINGEYRIFRDINSDDTSIPIEVMNFNAEVKEIGENGELLVTHINTAEGFKEMSGGDYYVSTENLRDEVNAGDTVCIWFNGSVRETYPAQLGMVYRIEKVELNNMKQ